MPTLSPQGSDIIFYHPAQSFSQTDYENRRSSLYSWQQLDKSRLLYFWALATWCQSKCCSNHSRFESVLRLQEWNQGFWRKKYVYKATLNLNVKSTNLKRASAATIPITDEENDSSCSGVASIGTQPQNFNLVLETCGSDVLDFYPSQSSTYKTASSSLLDIDYGSGSAQGTIAQDSVTFEMFRELLAVTNITSGLIDDGLSGIMGLSFASISALQTSPFWQSLYNGNDLSEPLFSFYLERHVNQPTQINSARIWSLYKARRSPLTHLAVLLPSTRALPY
ncbi:aspartic peptidase domain-containing protein [Suillus clintonianus]|uniref:aspartic peptidase domain-containing protein n=1 Tax=Suillus clintonianus TaxID=1904413 RepID=UPI001B86DCF7|nr:aspartic peptidase domain-containing protein [Suillus clintonianus]KAG2122599.1 aspartic peptidase domain-containing protein [Suillus clintonianus]